VNATMDEYYLQQEKYLRDLEEVFSKKRLSSYSQNKEFSVLEKYHANILLGNALVPSLHYLEIILRNRLDQSLKLLYHANWLLDPPKELCLGKKNLEKLKEIALKFEKKKKRKPTNDDVVAQLSFGFWCSFFRKKYDPILWQRKGFIKSVFPNLERYKRKRKLIESKMLQIKEIRNRIAHYEPVWNQNNVVPCYKACRNLIYCMSTEGSRCLTKIDHFLEVWADLQRIVPIVNR
jgi:hypothetical protein